MKSFTSNEKNHWIWGIFYYNKDDIRIFPPKKNPAFGWTVNFANPKSILALVLFLVFLASVILLIEQNRP